MPSVPSVFISYSWDSNAHRKWVRQLASRLVTNGVNVWLDQWHVAPGDSLTAFMERKIASSGHVLVVCTSAYARKANARRGGVGYEQQIISGRIAAGIPRRKFIPILRAGEIEPGRKCAIPTHFGGTYAIDMRTPRGVRRNFEELLRSIYRVPKFVPPARGLPLWHARRRRTVRLANADTDGWWLASGVARNQQYPKTFHIPSEAVRRSIKSGDLVKLNFEFPPDKHGCGGERMWAIVKDVDGPYFVGELNNRPVVLTKLRVGQRVVFLPEHVISVIPAEEIGDTRHAFQKDNRKRRNSSTKRSRRKQ